MQQRLIIGNWKMNADLAHNQALLNGLIDGLQSQPSLHQVVVCVPFPYLPQVQALLQHTPIEWGAQDLSAHTSGAYTGDVSASMLREFGCKWVLVGHSERRQYQHEDDALIVQKAVHAIEHDITPVICIGEKDQQHSLDTITQQLKPILALDDTLLSKIVIAYEPVWAIGTGLTATPEQAQHVHAFIRQSLSCPILYGGSVKANNANQLLAMPDINGALVGGASLSVNEFLGIIQA